MNANILSQPAPPETGAEPRSLIAALIAVALLALRYLKRKMAAQPDGVSRAEFYFQGRLISGRLHANHLSLLEKLDKNHRELLAALERQGNRIGALEAGFARLDERTKL
jgi:uncharacterized protein involved in exopolysaccharide biosynthesis